MSNAQDRSQDRGPQELQQAEQAEGRRSGEGAASAMQQLISQDKRHRHQTGEADDAAGGGGQ